MTQQTPPPADSAHPAGDPAGPLDPLLCFDLYAASRAVTAAYRPILGDLGLTYPQYLVLVVLAAEPDGAAGLPIKALGATIRLDHATLTPLLRRLEDAGLLTRRRSERDERSVVVALTSAGREVASHFDDVQCRAAEVLGLEPAQMGQLRDLLRAVTLSATGSL
ncbi:MarR family transcriptional regulator [Nocardioides sp. TRM66260-LWL]|uniref:MarR family winged helix-turn-helix transcriptional regulator n=1 Tax=Nocardioides sp. TRM66260-LWL TaxID=2874478 RepID=UPI001CC48CE6|nr:MarR family transcriptional regulator [Nocardioides sp. TRM66260-LWL]MBZ5735786.1 MarR family transcriptional regulator [Nocardioides sp. TRM66260-LWL]